MVRLDIIFDDKIAKKLRLRAGEVFGYKKGSLSKAVQEAVVEWLKKGKKHVNPTKTRS